MMISPIKQHTNLTIKNNQLKVLNKKITQLNDNKQINYIKGVFKEVKIDKLKISIY